ASVANCTRRLTKNPSGATKRASARSRTRVEKARLGLLHELVPKAVRIAVLINPSNAPVAEATLREIPEAARAIGLQIQVLNASTSREIRGATTSWKKKLIPVALPSGRARLATRPNLTGVFANTKDDRNCSSGTFGHLGSIIARGSGDNGHTSADE